MELLPRENVITAVCVVTAIAGFYAIGADTDVGDAVRYGFLVGVGVVLPTVPTSYSS